MVIIIYFNTLVFFLLGAVHIYWAFGGKWGMATALPTNEPGGERLFNPGLIGILVVAFGLFLFAAITLGNLELLQSILPSKYIKPATLVIACIILLRALGDFKYVGFAKKVKNTAFAKSDTMIFSPLCLYLGLTSLMLAI